MSGQPFVSGKFRGLDSNAVPLAGGLLYTYAAGTTTPQATYTDASLGTQNMNPVVLDSTGQADVWMTPGILYKFVLQNSSGVTQWTEDNWPSPSSTSANVTAAAYEPGGRLTLSSTLPVTNTDVTGATIVYYLPHQSDQIPIYDGTNWGLWSIGSSGLSQALADTARSPAATVANSCYDLFVWNNGGTITISRGPLWSSDTTRGSGVGTTQLAQQNGKWVNAQAITNGPGALKGTYVGTIRTDGSNTVNDAAAKRHVWNTYNRVVRNMSGLAVNTTWTYTTATWRQANANASLQLDFVRGLEFDIVNSSITTTATNGTGAVPVEVSIGIDETTSANAAALCTGVTQTVASTPVAVGARWDGYPGIGRHFLAWLEFSTATGTTTWNQQSSGLPCAIVGTSLF